MRKLDYRAKLVLHGADELDLVTAKRIAKWLRDLANTVDKDFMQFSKRFTARYMNP